MKKPSTAPEARQFSRLYRTVGLSSLLGVGITAVLLLLFALAMSSVDLPHGAVFPLAAAAGVAGCAGAGFISGYVVRKGGLLLGLACGGLIFLLTLFCELTFCGGEVGTQALYKLTICCFSGMTGGVFGVNCKRKVR